MTRLTTVSLVALALASSSCGAADQPVEPALPAGGSGSVAPVPELNPLGRARCQAPAGVSASPRDTQEAVALLNALPKPTSVPCFLESLARPLSLQATDSIFSAQPALSHISPRVFIKLERVWVSVVIDGDSSYLVEFGDLVDDDENRSIKGELQLPISQPVAPGAVYDKVMFSDSSTSCGLCHFDERRVEHLPFPNAYASIAFQPRPDTYVSVQSLRVERQLCNWEAEPHRCDMLGAIFGGGEVIELPFPSTMPTFF